jgi:hypothetical protein
MLQVINPIVIGGAVALAIFVGVVLFLRLGRRIGLGAIEFTFSGALSRFDVRRAQAVDEANAIGTAYLRIDLLPASAQPALREAFRSYVDARIATYRKLPDVEAAKRELLRSQQLQSEIWTQAVAGVRLPDSRPESELLLLPALNQMFDVTTVRVTATQMHPPLIIYGMLIGLAFVSALLAGYQSAGEKGYDWVHKLGFAAIVAITVYVILDIEYPRLGFVRLDAIDQVLVNARAAMK